MDARLLVEGKWMVSESFGLGSVPREPLVTIASVALEEQDGDGGREKWGVLHFAEPWARPLKINRTHQKALMLMFGTETDAWKGKRLGLYAMAGTFFGRRSTAVRIKGSPDLKAPCSFQVKRFGGGKDTYDLVPMPMAAPGASSPVKPTVPPAPFVPDGTVRIGTKKGTQIQQLTHEELAAAIALGIEQLSKAKPGATWIPSAQAHVAELMADQGRRAKLEEQMSAPAPAKASRLPIVDEPPQSTTEDAPF